jgi:hypothetical protein
MRHALNGACRNTSHIMNSIEGSNMIGLWVPHPCVFKGCGLFLRSHLRSAAGLIGIHRCNESSSGTENPHP